MENEARDGGRHPTSVVLQDLVVGAPDGSMPLTLLLSRLRGRSFGFVMLVLGVVALVPALSPVAGVLLLWPAIQMLAAREAPTLPRWLSCRRVPTARLALFTNRVVPVLRWLETILQPRWRTPSQTTKRVVGGVVLLLGLTLLAPVPFSQVLPALVIILIALAYLEEDGLALTVAIAAAILSLGLTAATVWATIIGINAL